MVKNPLLISLLLSTSILTACGGGSGQPSDQQSNLQTPGTTSPADQQVSPDTNTDVTPDSNTDSEEGRRPKPSPSPTPTPTPEPTPTPTPAPAPAPTSTSALTYQQLLDDMTKSHESYAHGVNPYWAWGSGPNLNVGVNFPSSFEDPHFTPWGVAATSTNGSPARNVRVQIRKIILDVKRNGQWTRMVYNTNANQLMGSLYTNYETNAHAPANVRQHGTDGISVRLPDSGGSFHFMTTERFRIARGAQEIVSRVEARLIVDDATRADDRASARLLVNSGGDIWRSPTASWNPSAVSNVDFAIGRFKYATNDWKSFSSHTLTTQSEINDYLANEPALSPR